MKRHFVAFAAIVLCSSCSSQNAITEPQNVNGSHTSSEQTVTSPSVQPGDTPSSNTSYIVDGPSGCIQAGQVYDWSFKINNNPNGSHIAITSWHDDYTPGCEPTLLAAFTGWKLVSGSTEYPAGTTGETILEFDARSVTCGRVQLDAAIDGKTVVGVVVNSGKACDHPKPVVPPVVPPVPPTPPSPLPTPPVNPPQLCQDRSAINFGKPLPCKYLPPPPPPEVCQEAWYETKCVTTINEGHLFRPLWHCPAAEALCKADGGVYLGGDYQVHGANHTTHYVCFFDQEHKVKHTTGLTLVNPPGIVKVQCDKN